MRYIEYNDTYTRQTDEQLKHDAIPNDGHDEYEHVLWQGFWLCVKEVEIERISGVLAYHSKDFLFFETRCYENAKVIG